MKKVLLGFFGGIIFVIMAIYKFMTSTEEIEIAFVQAWKAWFRYTVFGDEYVPVRRVRYRPYNQRNISNYYRDEAKRQCYKED